MARTVMHSFFFILLALLFSCGFKSSHSNHVQTLELAESMGGAKLRTAVCEALFAKQGLHSENQRPSAPTDWVWRFGDFPWLRLMSDSGFEMRGRCWSRRRVVSADKMIDWLMTPSIIGVPSDDVEAPAISFSLRADKLDFGASVRVALIGEVEYEDGRRKQASIRLSLARMGGKGRIALITHLSFLRKKSVAESDNWEPIQQHFEGYLLGSEVKIQIDAKCLSMSSASENYKYDFLEQGWPTIDGATRPVRAIHWQRVEASSDCLFDHEFGRQFSYFSLDDANFQAHLNREISDKVTLIDGLAEMRAIDSAAEENHE